MQQLKRNDFLRHNAVFFVGSLAVSAVNYLYYPVLGRLLPTSQFGEVQALVTLFLQANIFLSVVTSVAVNVVAGERNENVRNRVVFELERLAGFFTLLVVAGALIFVRPLQHFFQFPQIAPFFALAAALLVSAPLALRVAFIRGRSAFGTLSANNLLGAIAKLLASAALVLLGTGTLGAVGGLVVAQLIALFLARRQAARLGLSGSAGSFFRKPDLAIIRPQLNYTLLVLIVSLVTTTLFSFDILVVKHYFNAETAGLYAGVATIARIIYFLTGSIAGVLLSSVNRAHPNSQNRKLLIRSAILQICIGGVALAGFAAFPRLVIRLLIGSRYVPQAGLLPLLSAALFSIAMLNLLLNYDLALRRWSAAVIAILGMGITGGLVINNHASPRAVVIGMTYGALVTLGLRGLDSLRRWAQPLLALKSKN